MNNIIIERRSNDWIAYMYGNPEVRGYGTAANEAIGDLVASHPEVFRTRIQWPRRMAA